MTSTALSTFTPYDQAMVNESTVGSAVRYWELITARVRAGHLPDATISRPSRVVNHRAPSRHTTPAERAAVYALIGTGLSYRQIAERTGVTHSMVAWLAYRRQHTAHHV